MKQTKDFKFGGLSAEESGEDEIELLEIESEKEKRQKAVVER